MVLSDNSAKSYHEVGHGVIAYCFGVRRFEEITIDPNESPTGQVRVGREGVSVEQELEIFLAGPLAEAKFGASRCFGLGITFDTKDIEEFVSIAYEDLEIDGDFRAATASIHFHIDGSSRKTHLPPDPNLFSDLEHPRLRQLIARISAERFRELVRQCMRRLDDPVTWRTVEIVAEKIREVGSISGSCFAELVESANR